MISASHHQRVGETNVLVNDPLLLTCLSSPVPRRPLSQSMETPAKTIIRTAAAEIMTTVLMMMTIMSSLVVNMQTERLLLMFACASE